MKPSTREAKARQAKFANALARPELRWPTSLRIAPDGPVSAPVKAEDPGVRELIDRAIACRSAGGVRR